MDAEKQPAEVVEPVKGKVGFSFKHPTPLWATIIFRVEFFANKAVMVWVASTHLITAESKPEMTLALITIDSVVWGFAKSIGIIPPDQEK